MRFKHGVVNGFLAKIISKQVPVCCIAIVCTLLCGTETQHLFVHNFRVARSIQLAALCAKLLQFILRNEHSRNFLCRFIMQNIRLGIFVQQLHEVVRDLCPELRTGIRL